MSKASVSKKNVEKNGSKTVENKTENGWMTKMAQKSAESSARLMEEGQFFNGLPGKDHRVRAVFLSNEPIEAQTKNGSDVWQFQMFRVSSGVEQTMSILQNITQVTDQIIAIAKSNGGNLKDVWVDVEFIAGKGTLNYIKNIIQIQPAMINKEPISIEEEIAME
jgi:hypothetical protein